MRNFCGLSNDIKVRINSLSLEQKLEAEHTLNNWEWHNLLGDKPKDLTICHFTDITVIKSVIYIRRFFIILQSMIILTL